MSPLNFAILFGLLLAGGATAASCLIPEMTVAGIWGIPVLGFALLVGVIFRIGVYYDPRVQQSQESKKQAGYVAVCFLCYLVVFSTLDQSFTKEQHIGWIFANLLGVFTTLALAGITADRWVIKQTQERKYPSICAIRRNLLIFSSFLLVIAYLSRYDDLMRVVKPIVIFFAYSDWVFFASIYCGIFRDRAAVFESNGTIAERLREWIRSKTQPGKLFSTVQTVLTLLFLLWLIVEAVCQVPARYALVSKGLFAVVAAVSFYIGTRYDPRKPPETSRLVGRVVGVFAHFTFQIYFEWYIQNNSLKSNSYAFEVHSVTLLTLFLLVELLLLGVIFAEIAPGPSEQQNFLTILLIVMMYAISTVIYLLFHILGYPPIWKAAMLTLSTTSYYNASIYLISAIAGKYREVVRQAQPVLNVLGQIQHEVAAQNV
jgi:hypothetical protein